MLHAFAACKPGVVYACCSFLPLSPFPLPPFPPGGLGLKLLDEIIITEELAYGCTGISTAITANGLAVRGCS